MKYYHWFILVFLFISLFSCKTKQKDVPGYYLKDKWHTSILPYALLKEKPKKVFEYFYRGIEDINANPLPRKGSYEYFLFNDDGVMQEYTFHLANKNTMSWRYRFSKDAYQLIYNDDSTKGLQERLFINLEKTPDGDYLETEWLVSGGKKKAFIHYSDSGNNIIRNETTEGVGYENLNTIELLYDKDRLLQKTITSKVENNRSVSRQKFYYSKNKALDSIVKTHGTIISKTFFINNEHGDPVQEIKTVNNDTTESYTRKYIYDAKGNWIRLLEKENKGPKTPANSSPYVLISREIFY
ncbi:hypothetical protein [Ferruginibacter sp. HRS2-29]|uniref:hypothetical protein n=1 Tax=Ferruginibacter sp. HRS2-29 TaxID=2487334 RepID=UPI0020CC05C9|nr:hypothetical protein [Ferruginibacter sp. HRS2-29]MCP9750326.1 hypothetical protein [Ferruginibacter sp. HRS2-29]